MSVAASEMMSPTVDDEAFARELFDNIRGLADQLRETLDEAIAELESLTELVIRAHHDRTWRYMGYPSWEDCCKKEFGSMRLLRLPREMRKELHAALRRGGLSVRHTAAVTGCSKNTVLEDCGTGKPSQIGTPAPVSEESVASEAREVTEDSNVEYLDTYLPPTTPWQDTPQANRLDGLGDIGVAARAVSCDIANLVSLANLARRNGTMPTDIAEYLVPRVNAWISTLASLVDDAVRVRSATP